MPSALARGLADEARRHLRTNRTRRDAHAGHQTNPETPTGRAEGHTDHATARAVRALRAVCARRRLVRPALVALSAASVTDVVLGWGGPAVRAGAGSVAFILWISFPLSWGRPFIDWFVFGRNKNHGKPEASR